MAASRVRCAVRVVAAVAFGAIANLHALPGVIRSGPPVYDVEIKNVTIVDVQRGSTRSGVTILLEADRIATVTSNAPRRAAAVTVLDGRGRYLIPGLWDMHVHTPVAEFLQVYLANGVTGVRDMFSDIEAVRRWRASIESGAMIGPRLVFSGPIVDGVQPIIPGSLSVRTGTEARQAVARIREAGADFLKVYNFLQPAAYRALAAEARRAGLPFAGHVPIALSVTDAARAGQRSVEHLSGMLLACSRDEERRRAEALQALMISDFDREMAWEHIYAPPGDLIASFSEAKARRVSEALRKSRSWQTPTLVVLHALGESRERGFDDDGRFKYLPPGVRDDWRASAARPRRAELLARRARLFPKELDLVNRLFHAGVGLLAGTDTPNVGVFPGFGLHDELEWLVRAGLTPAAALQAATLAPALFLKREAELGTIEVGKRADLVLLENNPLIDIRNTRCITAVIARGRVFPRKALDAMLASVASAFTTPD